MRIAHTNEPRGRGYTTAYSQLLQDDGINTNDKSATKCFTDILWLHQRLPERLATLHELKQEMSPGQRARFELTNHSASAG